MLFVYLGVLAFSVLFILVYYYNSHNLRDIHMTLLFVPSLFALALFGVSALAKFYIGTLSCILFNIGFAWIWAWLCLSGVYNMAETSSNWLFLFYVFAIIFFVISMIALAFTALKKKKEA